MTQLALYFGALSGGHYLYQEKNKINSIEPTDISNFPWTEYDIDTGLLGTWKINDIPDGRVHWTRKGDPLWFAFLWWDRSGDRRTLSNSGFYVRGFTMNERAEAFSYACSKFSEIVNRQKFSLRLQPNESR